jgi:hypothetical protein
MNFKIIVNLELAVARLETCFYVACGVRTWMRKL